MILSAVCLLMLALFVSALLAVGLGTALSIFVSAALALVWIVLEFLLGARKVDSKEPWL